MAEIVRTTEKRSTWLGVPARQTVHHLERSATGLRIVEFRNDDSPDSVEVRLIDGDGRTGTFAELAKYEGKTQAEAAEIVAALAKAS